MRREEGLQLNHRPKKYSCTWVTHFCTNPIHLQEDFKPVEKLKSKSPLPEGSYYILPGTVETAL